MSDNIVANRPEPATAAGTPTDDLTGPVVNQRYRLFPNQPIAELDRAGARAFMAGDLTRPDDPVFAQLCPRETVIRGDVLLQLQRMGELPILCPIDWGAVDWPDFEQQMFAVLFPQPEHGALMPSYQANVAPMPLESITTKILDPITLVLTRLGQRGLTHRAIRPDNIFHSGKGSGTVILGDCVIGAPAAAQPAVFETVESAMTPPMGRGTGFITDDFYSLGATLLVLSLGFCPVAELSDEKIIAAKMQKGSYAALMAGHKPPFGLRELLRGLLCDDPARRWGPEEVQQWVSGTLRASVQDSRVEQTERPFRFGEVEINDCRTLSRVFGMNWVKAETIIRSGEFIKWIQRNVPNQKLCDALEAMIMAESGGRRNASTDRLATRVSMVLDPPAPLRYKGLTTMPSGLGPLLAKAFAEEDKATIQLIGECISKGVASDWYTNQSAQVRIQLESEIDEIKQLQQLLRQSSPGYGIERCLYMLNRSFPCLSPIVGDKYLDSLGDLLPTLENIVQEHGELPMLVDHHLPAFIASRHRGNLDRQLLALEDRKRDGISPKIGMLGILARMQSNFGPAELPFLTEWLARELEPALDRLKSRSRREALLAQLQAASTTGSLIKLNEVLNNDGLLRRDEGERRRALQLWNSTMHEIARLKSEEYQELSQHAGWRAASVISGAVATMSVIIMIAL